MVAQNMIPEYSNVNFQNGVRSYGKGLKLAIIMKKYDCDVPESLEKKNKYYHKVCSTEINLVLNGGSPNETILYFGYWSRVGRTSSEFMLWQPFTTKVSTPVYVSLCCLASRAPMNR